MEIQVLKSKLKKVIVTDANVEYDGSLTLDPVLMRAANLYEGEVVHVNSVNGKERIITYVLPGEENSGQVEMNGGAANFFKPGDKIHVNCFAYVDSLVGFKSIIVITGERNEIIEIR